jgi:nucleoid-associated protein YgaU
MWTRVHIPRSGFRMFDTRRELRIRNRGSRKMQKDLKIGLAVGLGLAAAAVVWVATRPSMSPEARIRQLHETRAEAVPPSNRGPARPEQSQEDVSETPQPVVSVINRSPEPNVPAPKLAPAETPPAEPAGGTVEPNVEKPVVANDQGDQQKGSFDSTVHEQTEKIETQRFYIVRKGDTLSKISLTYYGSSGKWRKIFDANKETIKNPDRLSPGQKLIIPD